MGTYFKIHPETPQQRIIIEAAKALHRNGVVLCPTDTGYAMVAKISSPKGIESIRQIRRLEEDHKFSILVSGFNEISKFARVSNWAFRVIKKAFPGPYTFIFNSLPEVPRKVLPKRKTIGIRMPHNQVCQDLIAELGEPLVASTAHFDHEEDAILEPEYDKPRLLKHFELILDSGLVPSVSSTIIDLTDETLNVLREGAGDVSVLG